MSVPRSPASTTRRRFLDWLAWEQWAILLVALIVLLAGIDWGLPNRRRMDLLLDGVTLTAEQRRGLTSAHDTRRETYLERRAQATRALLSGEEFKPVPPVTQPAALLSEEDKLLGLCSFVINSGDYDEALTYSSLSRMNPARLDFAPRYFTYGGAYLYPVGALLQVLEAAGVVRVTKDYAHYIDHPREMALIYMAGRALNIAAFVGVLFVLARLGLRIGGRAVGSLAMLVFAFSTLPLNQCLISKPHVYAAFWSTLGVLLALRYRDEPSRRRLVVLGVVWGMAVGSSLPCLLMVVVLGSLLLERTEFRRSAVTVVSLIATMTLTFLVTNPYAVLHWDRFAFEVVGHTAGRGWGYGVVDLNKLLLSLDRLVTRNYCFPVSLIGALTISSLIAGGGGQVRRLSVGTSLALLISHAFVAASRITVFTGPLFCLFSAYGLCALYARAGGKPRSARIAAIVLLLLPGAIFAALFAIDTIWDEPWYGPTRAWIESARLGAGTTIGICGAPWNLQLHPADSPPYPFVKTDVVNLVRYEDRDHLPEYVVVGVWGEGRERWESHALRPYYELTRTLGARPHQEWALRWRTPSAARVAAWVYEPRGRGDTP